MIRIPTVFILGAGSSDPYGLPTGEALTRDVAKTITYLVNSVDEQTKLKQSKINMDMKALETMGSHLKNCGGVSIDEWLSRNGGYLSYGRLLIAKEINKRENARFKVGDNNWYEDLWANYLLPDCQRSADLRANKVAFITFNYDRSLEHYLYQMAMNMFSGEREHDIAEAIDSLTIVHVHGSVGRLPWQSNPENLYVREYNEAHHWGVAENSASMIRIISEIDGNTQEYERARRLLTNAQRIYFIGFGYHSENLSRLCPTMGLVTTSNVWGSAYKLNGRERERLESPHNPFGIKIYLGNNNLDAVGFLKQHVPPF